MRIQQVAARIADNGVVVRCKACSSRTPEVKGIQLESCRGLVFPRVLQPIPLESGETICSHAIRLSPGHRGLCVAITGHSIKMRDRKTATAWPAPGCWSMYIFSPYPFRSTLLAAPRSSALTTSLVVQASGKGRPCRPSKKSEAILSFGLMRSTTRTTMATTAMTALSRSAIHCLSHLNLFSGRWRCFAVRSIYKQRCPDTPSPQSAVSSHATAILAFAHARKRGEREPELRPRRS
jgi:hypothetical protein